MAAIAQCVICLFSWIIPQILSLRYGTRSNTLHVPEPREEAYYGSGFQTIVSDALSTNYPVSGRFKRDVGSQLSPNIAHMVKLNDSHYQMIIHWAGKGSDVIIALTKDIHPAENATSSVYISEDYGNSFRLVASLGNATIDKYYNSPLLKSHYIFADVLHNKVYTTSDYLKTVEEINVPFSPKQLALHPTDGNIVLGYDDQDDSKQLWLSDNFGQSWRVIQDEVKSFFWGNTTQDNKYSLYVERYDAFSQSSHVIATESFFHESSVLLSGVEDFQLIDDYMFASKKKTSNHLGLWVSYKRQPFVEADFPYNDVHQDYFVADAAEDQVFLCVFHNTSATHLYISDVIGRHYSLSLKNVVYFNPKYWNDSKISIVREKPFADVYRVDGMPGFYIASQFKTKRFSLSDQISFISYDKGGSWQSIQAPTVDAYGNLTNCHHFHFSWGFLPIVQSCSLHLAQNFHYYHPEARTVPILSKKSAIGLIMATGTLGSSIGREMNVYVSSDGGIMWREAFKGTHFYAFGDYGGIIVAVRQLKLTGELYYSVNEGETWQRLEFSKQKVLVYGLLSEPGEKTTIFSVFASYVGKHEWIIIKVDLKSALGTRCTKDDYKEWSPSESNKVNCLLGQKIVYSRRRAHAVCYNGGDFERKISVQNCTCTELDYECDEGYRKKYPWGTMCELDPDSNLDVTKIPSPCPEGSYYKRSKGYRRVSGDKCHGGVESRLEPDRVLCPVKEQDEFILYTTRSSIHRRSFTSQQDEELPLVGLHDVIAVEFDYRQNCLYWADVSLNVIQKVCLFRNSSRDQSTIISDRLGTVESLALDWMGNILYWVDSDSATIEMAWTDGTHRRLLISNNTKLANGSMLHIEAPRSLVLYPKYGLMFWSDWSGHPSITRSYMDGSHVRTMASSPRVVWPNGLAIDDLHERLYWTDGHLHGIYSTDLHGHDFKMLVQNAVSLPHPYSISIYKNYVYWTDWRRNSILRMSLEVDHRIHTFIADIYNVMDMKILHYASQQGANSGPCSRHNGQCTSICIERPQNESTFLPLQRTCLCSDIYRHVAITETGEEHCECGPGERHGPGDTCVPINGTGTCPSGQFTCASGKCIPATWRCDRDHDCGVDDDSDEMDCAYETCPPTMFTCANNRCIPIQWVCDHDNDCGPHDDSDEPKTCVFRSCSADQFQCNNGRCISHSWRCDGDDDCRDGSDENATFCRNYVRNSTVSPSPVSCNSSASFLCDNQNCIIALWRCDGEDDCGDNSDEINCTSTTNGTCTEPWQHLCDTGECILKEWVCDGSMDCASGEDEHFCDTLTTTTQKPVCVGHFSFDCGNTVCVTLLEVCDGVDDCGNHADEDICGTTPWIAYTTTTLAPDCYNSNDFLCSDGDCIKAAWVCDGYNDCKNGDDEIKCNSSVTCPRKYFKCVSTAGCIPPNFICDGDADCADKSDEVDCGNSTGTFSPKLCKPGEIFCDNICLSQSYICDGRRDCSDGRDERSCSSRYRFDKYWVSSITPTSAVISWGHIQPKPPKLAKVQVMYRIKNLDSSWHNNSKTWTDTDVDSLKVTGLAPGTVYEYTLCVIDDVGAQCKPMALKNFTTGATAPGKPQDVRLKVISGIKGQPVLNVVWTEPSTTNGRILYYKVYAQQDDGAPFEKTVPVPSGALPAYYSANFTEFFEGERVAVWVTATNVMEGESSDRKQILIQVANKPHCCQILTEDPVLAYTSTANIQWEYQGDSKADHIDSFRIVFVPEQTLEVNITVSITAAQAALGKEKFTASVTGWSPDMRYLGYIQAHNASGYGHTCFNRDAVVTIVGQGISPPVINRISQDSDSHEVTVNVTAPQKPIFYTEAPWTPEVRLFYTSKSDALWSSGGMNSDILSVPVGSDGVVRLSGLLACNKYTFCTQLMRPLVSKLSPVKDYFTQMDEKAAPKQLSVSVMKSYTDSRGSINVNFTAPCDSMIKNFPLTYIITVKELGTNGSVRVTHGFPVNSSSPVVHHVIHNLHRGARYTVSVAVDVMDARDSNTVQILMIPHQAPTHFSILPNIDDGIVFLQWRPPKVLPQTNFTYGIYHAVDDGDYTVACHVSKDQNSYAMTSLEPSKIHKFKLRMDDVYGYPGEFTPVETFTTPSEEKWHSFYSHQASESAWSHSILSAIIVPCVLVITVLAVALTVYVLRHKRLQRSFLSYASSHYDTRSGTARFSTSDELDEEEQPMIQGFSDDEPLIVA